MYNITAKDYVVPNPQVSGDVAFYYKANYINNGPLFLLDRKTTHYFTTLSESLSNMKFPFQLKGLQNYWPFEGTTKDVTGGKNITLVKNSALSVDNFGVANSALAMTIGYATVPPGVYFDPATGGFTIMLWVKMLDFDNSKIIDFSNGFENDNIRLVSLSTGQVRLNVFKGSINKLFDSTSLLQLNQWAHIAASVNGSNGCIFINGILSGQGTGLFSS